MEFSRKKKLPYLCPNCIVSKLLVIDSKEQGQIDSSKSELVQQELVEDNPKIEIKQPGNSV